MWLMLQQDEAADYVIASGESHSVRELAACAFARVGLDWEDRAGGRVAEAGKAELHDLVGDATRAREQLGWSPTMDFEGSSTSWSTRTSSACARSSSRPRPSPTVDGVS